MKNVFILSVATTIAWIGFSIPMSSAQHISIGNMKTTIKAMLRNKDKERGENGRAFMLTNDEVPLNGTSSGKCLPIGPGNPGLEFDAENSSFDSFYSRAYFAYENKKTVLVRYDNSFGPGTNCKLTSIEIID